MAETGPKVSENNSVPFIVQHRLVVWRKCAEAVGWPIVSIQSGESLIFFFFLQDFGVSCATGESISIQRIRRMSCLSVSTFFGRVKVDCKEESRCFYLSAHLLFFMMRCSSSAKGGSGFGLFLHFFSVEKRRNAELQVAGSGQPPFHVQGLGDAAAPDC